MARLRQAPAGRRVACRPAAHLLIQPYVALQYLYLHTDRVLEYGGGSINGALDADDLHSLRTRLGLSTNLVRYARGALSFDAAWTHELLHETAALVDNRLAGSPPALPPSWPAASTWDAIGAASVPPPNWTCDPI